MTALYIQSMIDEFGRSLEKDGFPNIDRKAVVSGLRERVMHPYTQDQRASSLCGPAAFLYCVLHNHPQVYVKYVIDLYKFGHASLGSLKVKPSKGCRNYNPPKDKIPAVDWIALASLRDSENAIFDYESANDQAAGITMPRTLSDWFKALRYSHVINNTNLILNKNRDDLEACNSLYLHGKIVCLFINANMLQTKSQKLSSIHPDHWIVMRSKFNFRNDEISFDAYTWGKIHHIPRAGKFLLNDCQKNFYGYVACRAEIL